jgi:PRTRC genetic system ThiF family protein
MNNLLLETPSLIDVDLVETDQINITMVGCGGTGSHLASGLVSIMQALIAKGKRVRMCFFDGDIVEEKNVGRQLFSPGDIGQNKACVLAERLSRAFNVVIDYSERHINQRDDFMWSWDSMNVVVGCVDNPAARAVIANAMERAAANLWWLDCGNDRHSGQVALGNLVRPARMTNHIALNMTSYLPAPSVVYPSLLETPKATKRKLSCAELTALGEQGLMVNRMVASWAGAMLHDLLIVRRLRYFATEFNTQWGTAKSYAVDAPSIAAALGVNVADITWEAPKAKAKKVKIK